MSNSPIPIYLTHRDTLTLTYRGKELTLTIFNAEPTSLAFYADGWFRLEGRAKTCQGTAHETENPQD